MTMYDIYISVSINSSQSDKIFMQHFQYMQSILKVLHSSISIITLNEILIQKNKFKYINVMKKNNKKKWVGCPVECWLGADSRGCMHNLAVMHGTG